MATFEVEMPDGTIIENVPVGTTKAQLSSMLEKKSVPQQPQTKTSGMGRATAATEQYVQGLTANFADELSNPLGAAAATAYERMQGVNEQPIMQQFGQNLDKADQISQDRLNQQRTDYPVTSAIANVLGGASGAIGSAGTKIGGQVANLVRGGAFQNATTLAGRAARLFTKAGASAGAGAASLGLASAGAADGNRMPAAREGAILGASLGAAFPLAGAALGAAAPKIDDGFKQVGVLAKKYNIPLSLDQLTQSKAYKTLQKVTQELPFSGQETFRANQLSKWTEAVTNTLGKKARAITPEYMSETYKRLGSFYENMGKGKVYNLGDDFVSGLSEISDNIAVPEIQGVFKTGLNKITKNLNKDGTIDGKALNFVRQQLNSMARKTANFDAKEVLKDLENLVIAQFKADDPKIAAELAKVNQQYRNFLAIEPLAQKAKGGMISPTQLAGRVSKIYKRAYTTGEAGEIGELARVGAELLPELGGSDTMQKTLLGGAALASLVNPTALPVAVTAMGTGRAFQSGINRNQAIIERMLGVVNKGGAFPISQLEALPPKTYQLVLSQVKATPGAIIKDGKITLQVGKQLGTPKIEQGNQ